MRERRAAAGQISMHTPLSGSAFWAIITPMNDTTTLPPLPDRLSIDPSSPYHVAAVFENDVGIRFNDKERLDVEEYCISERWIKVASTKSLDRRGRPLQIKLKGKVEAFYR